MFEMRQIIPSIGVVVIDGDCFPEPNARFVGVFGCFCARSEQFRAFGPRQFAFIFGGKQRRGRAPIFEAPADAAQTVRGHRIVGIERAGAAVIDCHLIGAIFFVANFGHVAIENRAPNRIEQSQNLVERIEIEVDIAFFERQRRNPEVGIALDAARSVDFAIHGQGAVDIAERHGFDAGKLEQIRFAACAAARAVFRKRLNRFGVLRPIFGFAQAAAITFDDVFVIGVEFLELCDDLRADRIVFQVFVGDLQRILQRDDGGIFVVIFDLGMRMFDFDLNQIAPKFRFFAALAKRFIARSQRTGKPEESFEGFACGVGQRQNIVLQLRDAEHDLRAFCFVGKLEFEAKPAQFDVGTDIFASHLFNALVRFGVRFVDLQNFGIAVESSFDIVQTVAGNRDDAQPNRDFFFVRRAGMESLFELRTQLRPFLTRFVPGNKGFERFDAVGIDAQDCAFDVDASFRIAEFFFVELGERAAQAQARFAVARFFCPRGRQARRLGKTPLAFGIGCDGGKRFERFVIGRKLRQNCAAQIECAIDIFGIFGIMFGNPRKSLQIHRI